MVVHPPSLPHHSEQVATWGWQDTRVSWTWPARGGKVSQSSWQSTVLHAAPGGHAVCERRQGPRSQPCHQARAVDVESADHARARRAHRRPLPGRWPTTVLPGVATVTLRTAGRPAGLKLTTDLGSQSAPKLLADRRHLGFVTATVVDGDGVAGPTASGLPSEWYNLIKKNPKKRRRKKEGGSVHPVCREHRFSRPWAPVICTPSAPGTRPMPTPRWEQARAGRIAAGAP